MIIDMSYNIMISYSVGKLSFQNSPVFQAWCAFSSFFNCGVTLTALFCKQAALLSSLFLVLWREKVIQQTRKATCGRQLIIVQS